MKVGHAASRTLRVNLEFFYDTDEVPSFAVTLLPQSAPATVWVIAARNSK